MSKTLRKHRSRAERLESRPSSAIWEDPSGYDMYVYVEVGRNKGWVIHAGAAGSRDDLLVEKLLRNESFPTRREALQSSKAAREFLEQQGLLDGILCPAEI